MPNDIDLSTEARREHRAIAEKATPGPWAVEKYNGGPYPGPFQIWNVPEEKLVSISVEGPRKAALIAANSPDVVKAHVGEIMRLRAEVERLNEEAYWLALHLSNAMMVPAVLDSLQAASAPEGRIPTPKMIREQVRRYLGERDAARKAMEGA